MSKDIRSYFQCNSVKASPSPNVLKGSSGKRSQHKNSTMKKRTLIISDSDEDSDVVVESPMKKQKKNGKSPTPKKQKKEEKSKYFSANVSDVFGSSPVKQITKEVSIPKKAPVVQSPTVDSGIESQDSGSLEMHDNDDFAAVLSQLDEQEWSSPACPSKHSTSAHKTSPLSEFKSSSGVKPDTICPKSPLKSSYNGSPSKISPTKSKQTETSPSRRSSRGKPDSKSSLSTMNLDDSRQKSPVSSKIKTLETKSPAKSKSNDLFESKSKFSQKDKTSPIVEKNLKRSSPVIDEKVSKTAKVESKSPSKKSESKPQSTSSFYDSKPESVQSSPKQPSPSLPQSSFSLWVDKYKPKTTKQIVGQQGDKSVVNKLLKWLKNWQVWHHDLPGSKKPTKPSPWAKDDDGSYFKAALLSGPPGIGKTTTVTLVCQELGFDTVEFNASDTRSKRLLQEEVSTLLSCSSLTPFFSGEKKSGVTRNHVLVMDEVDGMAGNEDRGGVQELIQLIKTSKVPIICMCNDRSHPKIRSLVNYCFDLPFHRPRVEQIKAAMMSICFKEGLKVTPQVMADIITNSNQDIRATLNHLSMLAAQGHSDNVQSEAKNVKMGPWDVLRKVFSAEDQKSMSIFDKSDLFFHDYQVAPLFVHENYLSVTPHNIDKNKKSAKMVLFAKAAESLSKGDLVEKQIRQNSSWSLLPTQAMFSSVIPGDHLAGHVSGRIQFPMWFGKNSRGNRLDRLIQEIQIHTRLRMSSSKESINLDYMRYLRDAILEPMILTGSDGVADSLALLQHYCLTREDLDSICEVSNWPHGADPLNKIESKVKAAFTRAYNKASVVTPYALVAPVKKGKGPKADGEEEGVEEEGEADENEEQEEDNMDNDAMIMAPKKKTTTSVASSKAGTSSKAGSSNSKAGTSSQANSSNSKGGRGGRGGKGSRGGKK